MSNPLRQKFRDKHTAYGLWVTVEAPSITEMAAAMGLDWVCIDMEHGHLGFQQVIEHLRAANGSNTAVLVRVPGIEMSSVKRALDMGANGVIVPYIRSCEEVETAFSYGRYPPRGIRGVSGDRAVQWGLGAKEYLGNADNETLIVPLIETREAVQDIDSILKVQGLEAIFFGPADMSASYGYLGEWEGPGVAKHILDVRAKAEARGVAAGLLARTVEDSILRRDQGFSMVGLGSDMAMLIRGIRENLEALGAGRKDGAG